MTDYGSIIVRRSIVPLASLRMIAVDSSTFWRCDTPFHSATFENGLLSIALEREIPETMKPRKIEIGGAKVQQLEPTRRESRKAA